MEVALCAQECSDHAAVQMAKLNLQRKQDQFCDCVLRLRDSPGQLHPAHRCVLAASSPVLASMLSSTGVLVELQAPYFSESVLPPLLDYVYTGSIPYHQIQQQHHSLLTAACYLQMDELIEALRACQAELRFAENVIDSERDESLPHKDMNTKSPDNFCDLQLASCISAFGRTELTHASSTRSTRNLPEKHAHQYTSSTEAFKETSVHTDSSKDMETSASRIDSKHGVNYWKGTSDASASNEAGVSCSVLKSIKSKTKFHSIPQDFIQNIPSPAEVNDIANMDKEVQRDMLYSLDRVKSGIWQEYTDEDERSSSPVSRSCCGAVPVICHSSKMAVQLAQVPPHQPVPQASPRLSRTSVLRSTNVNNDSTAESIIAENKTLHGGEEQMSERHNENQPGTLSQDQKEGLNQCGTQDTGSKSTVAQPAQLEQAHNRINPDHFIRHNDECLNNGSDLFPPVPSLENNTGHSSIERHTSMEHDKIITEPQLILTMSVDSNMGGNMYSAISQRYQGHLHYHYLPDEDSHSSRGDCDEKHSQAHFDLSDRSGDEEDACTSPLKYHDAMESTEQVFLLDISTKPAELFVSCRRTSDSKEEADGQRDTHITNTDRKTPAGEDQTMSRADEADTVEEVSCFEAGESQISSWTVTSPSSVSDSVQASTPSTISVSVPSSLSASMPKNILTPYSCPITHSFQCTLCDRSFSQRGSLNRHMRSHLGIRPFPCPRCPMTFSRQYRVTEHMRVHQRCVFGNGLQKQSNSSI